MSARVPDANGDDGTGSKVLVSLGYEGRSAQEVVDALTMHGVEVLIDVRLTPVSRKPGLSKSALSDALNQVGIEYRHHRELGNPQDNREAFAHAGAPVRARATGTGLV